MPPARSTPVTSTFRSGEARPRRRRHRQAPPAPATAATIARRPAASARRIAPPTPTATAPASRNAAAFAGVDAARRDELHRGHRPADLAHERRTRAGRREQLHERRARRPRGGDLRGRERARDERHADVDRHGDEVDVEHGRDREVGARAAGRIELAALEDRARRPARYGPSARAARRRRTASRSASAVARVERDLEHARTGVGELVDEGRAARAAARPAAARRSAGARGSRARPGPSAGCRRSCRRAPRSRPAPAARRRRAVARGRVAGSSARGIVPAAAAIAAAVPAAWPIAMQVAIERADAWASCVAEKQRPGDEQPLDPDRQQAAGTGCRRPPPLADVLPGGVAARAVVLDRARRTARSRRRTGARRGRRRGSAGSRRGRGGSRAPRSRARGDDHRPLEAGHAVAQEAVVLLRPGGGPRPRPRVSCTGSVASTLGIRVMWISTTPAYGVRCHDPSTRGSR